MNYIHYQRLTEGKDFTIGEFRICKTKIHGYLIEPGGPSTKESGKDRRIPPGTYSMVWHTGTRFKKVPKLFNGDVPVDRAILIHVGNRGHETEGCLLPGTGASGTYVTNSKAMLEKLKVYLDKVGIKNVQFVVSEISGSSRSGLA